MEYVVQFKPRAIKDLKSIHPDTSDRIIAKIELLQNNLSGDVKKLTNFTPEYRLRVEIEGNQVIIYRIKHRSEAYS